MAEIQRGKLKWAERQLCPTEIRWQGGGASSPKLNLETCTTTNQSKIGITYWAGSASGAGSASAGLPVTCEVSGVVGKILLIGSPS